MLLLTAMIIAPLVMLMHLAWLDTQYIADYYRSLERWSFACSESAVWTVLTDPMRKRDVSQAKSDETLRWQWPVTTPLGQFSASLVAVGGDSVTLRGTCMHVVDARHRPVADALVTTRMRVVFRGSRPTVLSDSWMECGFRSPCRPDM